MATHRSNLAAEVAAPIAAAMVADVLRGGYSLNENDMDDIAKKASRLAYKVINATADPLGR